MCSDIYAHWAAIWRFGWVGGAEPTNNTAEQAVRPAVRLRNNSFGTQSPSGSRFVEKMMTVVETCRRQGRNALGFLKETMRAASTGARGPTLVCVPDS